MPNIGARAPGRPAARRATVVERLRWRHWRVVPSLLSCCLSGEGDPSAASEETNGNFLRCPRTPNEREVCAASPLSPLIHAPRYPLKTALPPSCPTAASALPPKNYFLGRRAGQPRARPAGPAAILNSWERCDDMKPSRDFLLFRFFISEAAVGQRWDSSEAARF